jgi:micrococcal nuclease
VNAKVITALGLWLVGTQAHAAEAILTGQARTVDGDTIEIGGVSVRLKGIAAPECNEPGGAEATTAMQRLIDGQEVRCLLTGERTHGRAVGYCSASGVDLNGAIVRGGWALSCPRFSARYVGTEPRTGIVQRTGYHLPSYCVALRRKG